MRRKGKLDRRSFLAQVVGGTVGGSALLVIGAGAGATTPEAGAERRMMVDTDPSDPARDPPEPVPTPARRPMADSDSGPNADPAGYGRGTRRRSGVTDLDSGANADPAGAGRAAAVPAPRESFVICPGNPRCPQ